MERAVALQKLRKLLGKSVAYRIDSKAPEPEERAAARSQRPAAVQERNSLSDQKDARRKAILEADAEYQSLRAAHNAAQKRVDEISSLISHYKITVGTAGGMFFVVKAEGDSWEEILGKLSKPS